MQGVHSKSPFVLENYPSKSAETPDVDFLRNRDSLSLINSHEDESNKEDLGRKDTIFERDWDCWDAKSNEFIRHLVRNNFNVSYDYPIIIRCRQIYLNQLIINFIN